MNVDPMFVQAAPDERESGCETARPVGHRQGLGQQDQHAKVAAGLQQVQCVTPDLLEIALRRRHRLAAGRKIRPSTGVASAASRQRFKRPIVPEFAPTWRVGRDRRQQPVQIEFDCH